MLCRRLDLFSEAIVAIDGSKFKAVNNRDKNFTDHKLKKRMEQLEESIGRYLAELDRADRDPTLVTEGRVSRLKEKVATVKAHMEHLKQIGQQLREAPDGQVSLTDPDARSMATSGRGTGIVGYNVQTAVDTKHHLIVAHEVTNVGHDRTQLFAMATQARSATGKEDLTVVADRGYFKGEEILDCDQAGMTPLVPKPLTSNSKADGRFDKRDFVYIAEDDEYRCPAGQRAIKRFTTIENGMTLHKYWSSACPRCPLKAQCTTSDLPAHRALGTRSGPRGDAGAPRSPARRDEATPANRRTSFRHAQSLDGRDAFPDQAAASRQYRDESPCTGLQPQTRHADRGHRTADAGDEGIRRSVTCAINPAERAAKRSLPSNFRNNLDQLNHAPQSRIARQWLSQTLPSAPKWRDHADLTFPHGLGRKRSPVTGR